MDISPKLHKWLQQRQEAGRFFQERATGFWENRWLASLCTSMKKLRRLSGMQSLKEILLGVGEIINQTFF